jgi:hypothetical protein
VGPVLIAPGTVFAPLDALGVLPLVLIRKEVAAFALGAFQRDFISGQCSFLAAIGYWLMAISGSW